VVKHLSLVLGLRLTPYSVTAAGLQSACTHWEGGRSSSPPIRAVRLRLGLQLQALNVRFLTPPSRGQRSRPGAAPPRRHSDRSGGALPRRAPPWTTQTLRSRHSCKQRRTARRRATPSSRPFTATCRRPSRCGWAQARARRGADMGARPSPFACGPARPPLDPPYSPQHPRPPSAPRTAHAPLPNRPPPPPAAQCEDPAALALARDAAPLDRLRGEARATVELNRELGEHLELGEVEVFVQGLLLWFKSSFFSWVVRPPPPLLPGQSPGPPARCQHLDAAQGKSGSRRSPSRSSPPPLPPGARRPAPRPPQAGQHAAVRRLRRGRACRGHAAAAPRGDGARRGARGGIPL
jgi:hypothetical protein